MSREGNPTMPSFSPSNNSKSKKDLNASMRRLVLQSPLEKQLVSDCNNEVVCAAKAGDCTMTRRYS